MERGEFKDFCGPGAPCAPTDTPPGSEDRILIYRGRAFRRQLMFHPRDRRDHDVSPTAALELLARLLLGPEPEGLRLSCD